MRPPPHPIGPFYFISWNFQGKNRQITGCPSFGVGASYREPWIRHWYLLTLMIDFFFACNFRVFFIGAQDGNFPAVLSMINYRFMTPAPAIIATVSTTYFVMPRLCLHWRRRTRIRILIRTWIPVLYRSRQQDPNLSVQCEHLHGTM